MKILLEPLQFEWDSGNKNKNWVKHKVGAQECGEAFFDPNKRIFHDIFHSGQENRYILLGQTKQERLLYIVFTVRNKKIRVISARDLNKKERSLYEETA